MRNLYQFGEKATLRSKMRNKQTELVKTAINKAILWQLYVKNKKVKNYLKALHNLQLDNNSKVCPI